MWVSLFMRGRSYFFHSPSTSQERQLSFLCLCVGVYGLMVGLDVNTGQANRKLLQTAERGRAPVQVLLAAPNAAARLRMLKDLIKQAGRGKVLLHVMKRQRILRLGDEI